MTNAGQPVACHGMPPAAKLAAAAAAQVTHTGTQYLTTSKPPSQINNYFKCFPKSHHGWSLSQATLQQLRPLPVQPFQLLRSLLGVPVVVGGALGAVASYRETGRYAHLQDCRRVRSAMPESDTYIPNAVKAMWRKLGKKYSPYGISVHLK